MFALNPQWVWLNLHPNIWKLNNWAHFNYLVIISCRASSKYSVSCFSQKFLRASNQNIRRLSQSVYGNNYHPMMTPISISMLRSKIVTNGLTNQRKQLFLTFFWSNNHNNFLFSFPSLSKRESVCVSTAPLSTICLTTYTAQGHHLGSLFILTTSDLCP